MEGEKCEKNFLVWIFFIIGMMFITIIMVIFRII